MYRIIVFICAAVLLCGCEPNKEEAPTVTAAVSPLPTAAASVTPTPMPSAMPKASQPKLSAPPKASVPAVPVSEGVKILITGADGEVILPVTEVEFSEGQTVFTVLYDITRGKGIHMEYSGSKKYAYVKGINNLYEFDRGGTSGWKYSVNGEFPNKSCGAYSVKKGDIIEWKYFN